MNGKLEEVDMGDELEKEFSKDVAEKSSRGEISVTPIEEPVSKDAKKWSQYPDYYRSRKKIGRFVVELVAGKDRGGLINIWEFADENSTKGYTEEVTFFRGKCIVFVAVGNYMESQNALERYRSIKTVRDISEFLTECL